MYYIVLFCIILYYRFFIIIYFVIYFTIYYTLYFITILVQYIFYYVVLYEYSSVFIVFYYVFNITLRTQIQILTHTSWSSINKTLDVRGCQPFCTGDGLKNCRNPTWSSCDKKQRQEMNEAWRRSSWYRPLAAILYGDLMVIQCNLMVI